MDNKNFKLPRGLAEAMLQNLLLAYFSENNKKIPEVIQQESLKMLEPFKEEEFIDFRELNLYEAIENIKKEAIKILEEVKIPSE